MQDYEAKISSFEYGIEISTMEASKTTLFNFLQKEMDSVCTHHTLQGSIVPILGHEKQKDQGHYVSARDLRRILMNGKIRK